jgi:hypothetical protein
MKPINEKKLDSEQSLVSEIDSIADKLRLLDPKSDEFTILLSRMKEKINKMSDE